MQKTPLFEKFTGEQNNPGNYKKGKAKIKAIQSCRALWEREERQNRVVSSVLHVPLRQGAQPAREREGGESSSENPGTEAARCHSKDTVECMRASMLMKGPSRLCSSVY